MPSSRASVVGPAALFQVLRFVALALLVPAVLFSLACGHGSSAAATTVGVAPTFTSTASPIAQEGILYTYNLTATTTDSSTVTYALTTGPTGAAISGSTLSWTPTHAESRISNSFSITATTSNNGTAVQAFTITPNGNVDGTVVDHAVTTGGIVDVNEDLSALTIEVLFPNPKGGYNVLRGSGDSSGTFRIPNVPMGSFLLHLPSVMNGVTNDNYIWTNASDIDAGRLVLGRPGAVPETKPLTVNANAITLTPGSNDTIEWKSPDAPAIGDAAFNAPVPNPFSSPFQQYENLIDSTKGDRAYLLHYKNISAGLDAITEDIEYKSITETDGTPITITGSMTAVNGATTDPVIKFSQFDAIYASLTNNSTQSKTFLVEDTAYAGSEGLLPAVDLITGNLPSTTGDIDLGSLTYGTVTPSGTAYFLLNDSGYREYTVNGNSFAFAVGSQIVSNTIPVSTSPIVPALGMPVSPQINGQDFLTSQTILTTVPQISWAAPGLGTITSYQLHIFDATDSAPGNPVAWNFYTNANSVTVPSGILRPGKSYIFILTAESNSSVSSSVTAFATAPFREGALVETTYETSGLMTIGGTTTAKKSIAAKPGSAIRVAPGSDGYLHIERK